jgi:hypothetical protein
MLMFVTSKENIDQIFLDCPCTVQICKMQKKRIFMNKSSNIFIWINRLEKEKYSFYLFILQGYWYYFN